MYLRLSGMTCGCHVTYTWSLCTPVESSLLSEWTKVEVLSEAQGESFSGSMQMAPTKSQMTSVSIWIIKALFFFSPTAVSLTKPGHIYKTLIEQMEWQFLLRACLELEHVCGTHWPLPSRSVELYMEMFLNIFIAEFSFYFSSIHCVLNLILPHCQICTSVDLSFIPCFRETMHQQISMAIPCGRMQCSGSHDMDGRP